MYSLPSPRAMKPKLHPPPLPLHPLLPHPLHQPRPPNQYDNPTLLLPFLISSYFISSSIHSCHLSYNYFNYRQQNPRLLPLLLHLLHLPHLPHLPHLAQSGLLTNKRLFPHPHTSLAHQHERINILTLFIRHLRRACSKSHKVTIDGTKLQRLSKQKRKRSVLQGTSI